MNKYIERAQIEGFTNWLDEEANRGWYTCLITEKKFRGQKAKDMIDMQEKAITEWEWEEEQEEINHEEQIIADIEQDYQEIEEQNETKDSDEAEMTDSLMKHLHMNPNTKTIIINCVDCNKERRIKPQDAFQTKRCISCQRKHTNRRRAERRRKKAQEQTISN